MVMVVVFRAVVAFRLVMPMVAFRLAMMAVVVAFRLEMMAVVVVFRAVF